MTIRELITKSLKMMGVLAANESMTDSQSIDGLSYVQNLYKEIGNYGKLKEKIIESNYTATDSGERLTLTGDYTITLPLYILEYGDTRPVRDGARVIITKTTDNTNQLFIYDANVAKWVDVNLLNLNDIPPLFYKLNDGLAALIAVRYSPEFGVECAPAIQRQAQEAENNLRRLMVVKYESTTDPFFYNTRVNGFRF